MMNPALIDAIAEKVGVENVLRKPVEMLA